MSADFLAEEVDFVDDELFHAFDGIFFLKVEVEGLVKGYTGQIRYCETTCRIFVGETKRVPWGRRARQMDRAKLQGTGVQALARK